MYKFNENPVKHRTFLLKEFIRRHHKVKSSNEWYCETTEILIQKLTAKSCSSATNLSSVGKYLSEKSFRTSISFNI